MDMQLDIQRFNIDSPLQTQGENLRVSSPCPCGCSPYPFVLISDGKIGLSARFKTEEELDDFKQAVASLEL